MVVIGVELDGSNLVLTKGRDFRWTFLNLDENNEPIDYPAGDLYFELDTVGGKHNSIQQVDILHASGGSYKLGVGGQLTAPIDYYDATTDPYGIDSTVQAALEALSTVGTGNVVVHQASLVPVWDIGLTLNNGTNEVQAVAINGNVSGGTFTLSRGGYTTTDIVYNAAASAVQSALEALPTVGAGNVSVSAVTGGYSVTFTGTLAAKDVEEMTADGSKLTATPPTSIATTQSGVAPVNEVQTITISGSPTGGTFTLALDGIVTAPIAFNAAAHSVQSALEALSNVGTGNVTVIGNTGGPYTVTFVNALGGQNVSQMTSDATGLTGGTPAIAVVTTTPGVAGVNEKQTVTLQSFVTGGTFTLSYSGYTTTALAYNASAATVQAALQALANVGAGGVAVTGGAGSYTITFQGTLGSKNVDEITADGTLLTGATAPSATVTTTTQGNAALTEPIVNQITKTVHDYFNTLATLNGTTNEVIFHDNLNATVRVTSLKTYTETGLITFSVNVTPATLQAYFDKVTSLKGIFTTITVDLYWNHTYQVEFVNDLGNKVMDAMTTDFSTLTGTSTEKTVKITVLEPGRAEKEKWHFVISGSRADIKVDSEVTDLVPPRTSWQLVFLPEGEPDGGDPIGRGKVLVQQ